MPAWSATLVAVRDVAGEAAARAAAPFLALDAGRDLVVVRRRVLRRRERDRGRAARRSRPAATGRRADALAVLGGLAFAATAFLSYGLVLLAVIPAAVAVHRRRCATARRSPASSSRVTVLAVAAGTGFVVVGGARGDASPLLRRRRRAPAVRLLPGREPRGRWSSRSVRPASSALTRLRRQPVAWLVGARDRGRGCSPTSAGCRRPRSSASGCRSSRGSWPAPRTLGGRRRTARGWLAAQAGLALLDRGHGDVAVVSATVAAGARRRGRPDDQRGRRAVPRAGGPRRRARSPTAATRSTRPPTTWPDLVVLDLMLPGIDGLEVCRRLRAQAPVPVIMLTARGDEEDRVLGLELGADDYVVKPFSPRELTARVRAVLRRAAGAEDARRLRGAGDRRRRSPHRSPRPGGHARTALRVTPHRPRVRPPRARRRAIRGGRSPARSCSNGSGATRFGDTATVTVHVRRLREKIEADPSEPEHLVTVWGVGLPVGPMSRAWHAPLLTMLDRRRRSRSSSRSRRR